MGPSSLATGLFFAHAIYAHYVRVDLNVRARERLCLDAPFTRVPAA